jgi:hypothetical protein
MCARRNTTALCGSALLALFLSGMTCCSSAGTGPSSLTARIFSTTTVNGHFHMVTIDQKDVQAPPQLGLSDTTTLSRDHAHSLAISELELATVNEGTPVTLTTGTSDVGGAHTHEVTIRKWF